MNILNTASLNTAFLYDIVDSANNANKSCYGQKDILYIARQRQKCKDSDHHYFCGSSPSKSISKEMNNDDLKFA